METLGLKLDQPSSPDSGTASATQVPKLMGIGQAALIGSGLVGGGSVVLAAIELIRSEPEKAFRLLQAWGPYVFLAMFVAWTVFRIANQGLALAQTVGMRMADAVEKVAVEQRAQAVALQQSADKDDRNFQEMQTLTSFTAQRSEKTYAMMQAFHEDNQMILKAQQASLDRIEAKVDAKIAATEKS